MNKTVRHVDLKRNEVDYLAAASHLPPTLLKCLENVRWHSGAAGIIEVSAATVEEFREFFTERLAKFGFDESYEPTAEGRLLEDLIDRFHEGS